MGGPAGRRLRAGGRRATAAGRRPAVDRDRAARAAQPAASRAHCCALTNPRCCTHPPPLQVLGHFAAKLDPLDLDKRVAPAELDPAYWGFTEHDLDRE